nr:MAG TPA: hypothetical protein [Caudoviricetes sp.]
MDKTIDDLLAAEAVTADDLFVVQQNATAKKVSGDTLRRYVGAESDLPKPDGAEDGSFLRIRNKKWVAEKSPALIDLYSAGVNVVVAQLGGNLPFEVSADIVTQLVAAAKNGGALLKFGYVEGEMRLPMQAYLVAGVVESMEVYQFSGKLLFNSLGVNVFFTVQLQDSNTHISSCCTIDQPLLPIPEPSDDGAFLRAQNGEWVMAQVPMAEGGTF